MEEKNYTVVENVYSNEYFFARYHSGYGLGDGWVPCTFKLPMNVVPRKGLESGKVETLDQYKAIFHNNGKQINHPFPELDEGDYNVAGFYKKLEERQGKK